MKYFLTNVGAISIDGVDLFDCVTLGRAGTYQSVDLVIARSIEECTEDILAIAEKILRAAANDDAWAARKCVIDHLFGNGGDAARIKQFQAIGWRQGSLECSSKKRLKDAINRRIIFPFPLLDRLRRAVGQACDFLSQFVVPQLPAESLGEQLAISEPPQPNSRSIAIA